MLELVFNLIFAHLVADFYLQTDGSCKKKVLHGVRDRSMWIHTVLVGLLAWMVVWDVRGWWLALAIAVSHLLIDVLKSWLQVKWKVYEINNGVLKRGSNAGRDLYYFLADQVLHVAVLCLLAWIWRSVYTDWQQIGWVADFVAEKQKLVYTGMAMMLALKPANVLILCILNACKVGPFAAEADDHGNFRSGKLIGYLERGLMLLFVVLQQYEALGFLIAAKSILRYSEATSGSEKSEYVLTGTLLSLSVSLVLGVAVLMV